MAGILDKFRIPRCWSNRRFLYRQFGIAFWWQNVSLNILFMKIVG